MVSVIASGLALIIDVVLLIRACLKRNVAAFFVFVVPLMALLTLFAVSLYSIFTAK